MPVTDDEKERIAIEVEHLTPEDAQREYDRRLGQQNEGTSNVQRTNRPDKNPHL